MGTLSPYNRLCDAASSSLKQRPYGVGRVMSMFKNMRIKAVNVTNKEAIYLFPYYNISTLLTCLLVILSSLMVVF